MPENNASGGRPKPGTVSFAMWVGEGLNSAWADALKEQGFESKAQWVRTMMVENLGISMSIGTASPNGRT